MSAETPGTPATTWYSATLLAVVEMILDSQDVPSLVESREGDSTAMPWARAVLDAAADEVAAREAAAREEFDGFTFAECPEGRHVAYGFEAEDAVACPGCNVERLGAEVARLRDEVATAEQRGEELHERMESLRRVWLASQAMETLDAEFSRRFARWDEEDDPAAVTDTDAGGAS